MGQRIDKNRKPQLPRPIFFMMAVVVSAAAAGCGGIVGPLTSAPPPATVQSLTAADVTALTQAAAQDADANTMVIAVVDRSGNVLGVYRKPSAPSLAAGNFSVQVDAN